MRPHELAPVLFGDRRGLKDVPNSDGGLVASAGNQVGSLLAERRRENCTHSSILAGQQGGLPRCHVPQLHLHDSASCV